LPALLVSRAILIRVGAAPIGVPARPLLKPQNHEWARRPGTRLRKQMLGRLERRLTTSALVTQSQPLFKYQSVWLTVRKPLKSCFHREPEAWIRRGGATVAMSINALNAPMNAARPGR
jgi:hypothetical protein